MICRQCQQEKVKNRAEKRNAPRRGHYFRDERGRMWQGNQCPDCFWPTDRAYYKEDEDEAEMHPDRFFEPDPIGHRKCRKCEKNLPMSRYFYHAECEPSEADCLVEELGGWE